MTFFRSFCLLLPAACLLAQTPAPAPVPQAPQAALSVIPSDTVVITVGDRKITAQEFNQIVDSLPEQSRAAARGPNKRQFADNLAQMLALAQEGRREKLDQTPEFKALVEIQTENALAVAMATELSKSNKPDDAQIKKYYDDHHSEFEQVKVSHILVRYQGTQALLRPGQKDLTEAEALAKIQALRQRIEGGEEFAKIATQESDDTGSGSKGGELGAIDHGQTVPAFEEAAFALKPGELSQPVKTAFGYHLIKVTSVDFKPLDSVRSQIENQLSSPLLQKAVLDVVKKAAVTLDPEYFPTPPPAK